jgi:hypothetical protein
VNFGQYNNGGTLGQGALTMDYVFNRGRVGCTAEASQHGVMIGAAWSELLPRDLLESRRPDWRHRARQDVGRRLLREPGYEAAGDG